MKYSKLVVQRSNRDKNTWILSSSEYFYITEYFIFHATYNYNGTLKIMSLTGRLE